MRLPFAVMDGVTVTEPSKSGNALNAGIDFYIPTKGVKIEFNKGFEDDDFIYMGLGLVPNSNPPELANLYTKKDTFAEISSPVEKADFTVAQGNVVVPRINEDGTFNLYPGENVLIHSGIAIETDFGQFEFVCNRSGVASKNCLIVGAHVIDTGYANELMFDIHNVGLKPAIIRPGDKITQLVVCSHISCTPTKVPYEDLYKDMQTEFRGLKGFGSSDKK